jgi:hypothetical protein
MTHFTINHKNISTVTLGRPRYKGQWSIDSALSQAAKGLLKKELAVTNVVEDCNITFYYSHHRLFIRLKTV